MRLKNWCNTTWDGFLCWHSSPPNGTVHLPCPRLGGLDVSKNAHRVCTEIGQWQNDNGSPDNISDGWTNYTTCYTEEMKNLLVRAETKDFELKMMLAEVTRMLELVGFSVSLVSLLISVFIFFYFRSLRGHKTSIHKNLLLAVTSQVVIRLIIYFDQMIITNGNGLIGIRNTFGLCEAFYVLLEYTRTAMFTWCLVEGIYLNQVICVTVISYTPNYPLYYFIGWGSPVLVVTAWAAVTGHVMKNNPCWTLYSLSKYFWIIEGPRFVALSVNLIILLITLKIVYNKLKVTDSCKPRQLLKSVKAALVLVPLLGLCNIPQMIDAPLHKSAFEFGLWSLTSHFLTSFQGFFISIIYCFMNRQVHVVVQNRWKIFSTKRNMRRSRSSYRSISRGMTSVQRDHRVDISTDFDSNLKSTTRWTEINKSEINPSIVLQPLNADDSDH
ncbi:pdfr-1 (predicted) [Pycnogonum litorale]